MGLSQLSSCLKSAGHSVFLLDLNIKLYLKRNSEYRNIWAWEQSDFWYDQEKVEKYSSENLKEIDYYLDQVIHSQACIFGFSVNKASMYVSLYCAKRIKEKKKDALIVFGGPLFINNKYINEILACEDVDIVVYGEGENSILSLVTCIEKQGNLSSVLGIAFRKNGAIAVTREGSEVDLEALPFLDLESLHLSDYDIPSPFSFMASRGCIRRCHFCSDSPCSRRFRAMSGERIYRELRYHNEQNKSLSGVDFLDLAFNGDMKSLLKFCELMIKDPINLRWSANMLIRPEMDKEAIKNLALAGCERLTFGIESGSERVLKSMNKNFKIADAERIICQAHQENICVTANFMFGFPGETEQDFTMTLDFLQRNAKYLDRVYPSRTYFAIEEFSYIASHMQEFNIKPDPRNHLFWESQDGLNTYLVRMQRCRTFCELASQLGVEVGAGVQTNVVQDEYFNLIHYHESVGNYSIMAKYLLLYHRTDPSSVLINNKIMQYQRIFINDATFLDKDTLRQVSETVSLINDALPVKLISRFDKNLSPALMKSRIKKLRYLVENEISSDDHEDLLISIVQDPLFMEKGILFSKECCELVKLLSQRNTRFIESEFREGKYLLNSFPAVLFLQFAGPCNAACVFCSRGKEYNYSRLSRFRKIIEPKIVAQLLLAEQIIFTGSGEFLRLKEGKDILDYFDRHYPISQKMFATNGSSLRPDIVEQITQSQSQYIIHVSLHAASSKTHAVITRMNNFEIIRMQIKDLIEKRKRRNNVKVDLFFVATVLNIHELPDFVRLAKDLGVDSVVVNYNYIYIPSQKYLSCYFKQKETNMILDEAQMVASELKISISLPPKFGETKNTNNGLCRELWSQIMLNDEGHVLPCDASHDCNLRLTEVQDFRGIWNSKYYVDIRKSLIETRHAKCFDHCHRVNPGAIDNFASHVIHRGEENKLVDILWSDNL